MVGIVSPAAEKQRQVRFFYWTAQTLDWRAIYAGCLASMLSRGFLKRCQRFARSAWRFPCICEQIRSLSQFKNNYTKAFTPLITGIY
jgi:hypothetical protein